MHMIRLISTAAMVALLGGCSHPEDKMTLGDIYRPTALDPDGELQHDLIVTTTEEQPIETRVMIREFYPAETTTRHQDTFVGSFPGDISSFPYWVDGYTVNVCDLRRDTKGARSLTLRTGKAITITTACDP